jgi:hypothetical protein
MKKTLAIILLILAACTAPEPGHGQVHTAAKVMKVHATSDELKLHDFTISFERPAAEAGKELQLKFKLNKNGKPMELKLLHERLGHLILVRNDLRHFDHLHPKYENGVFTATKTFPASGEYRLWLEFTDGILEHIIDYSLNVTGMQEMPEPDTLGGLAVNIQTSELQQDKRGYLNFAVTENDKPIPITEKLLGADAHLIIIKSTLDEFEHLHDETGDKDNLLAFSYTPEYSGDYEAWVEFAKDGKEQMAKFDLTVEP